MAKQQPKSSVVSGSKKSSETEFSSFTYLWRNSAIAGIIGIILLFAYKSNEKQGRLPELYSEFQQLRQANANLERQQELYNQIVEIQNDTSLFKSLTRGYYWAIHDLALGNLEQINSMKEKIASGQMKSLTLEDKLNYKVGVYSLLKYVKENTPENAVILLPPGDSAISNNNKWNFIYAPDWVEYFIYPRLCVAQGQEADHPDLAKRATHVLIIEGKGYERLKYNVPAEQRAMEAILPIDNPPSEAKPQ